MKNDSQINFGKENIVKKQTVQKIDKNETVEKAQIVQKSDKNEKTEKTLRKKISLWLPFIFVFTLALAFGIALASESFEANSVIICVAIILALLILAFVGDVFSMSVTYAEPGNLNAMASRKVKGAKMASVLIKNKDRVSTILSDILGDVCATVAGAVGVALTVIIIQDGFTAFQKAAIGAGVSAVVAASGVLIKAVAKRIGMRYSTNIVLFLGKMLSIFKK